MEQKKMYRLRDDRIVAGVCSGLGEYFGVDSTLIRLIFVILTIWGGIGIILYIVCWVLLPEKNMPKSEKSEKEEKAVASNAPKTDSHNVRQIQGAEVVGLIVLLFGLLFLFRNVFSMFHWFNANYFWPIILIVVGIFLIATAERNKGGK